MKTLAWTVLASALLATPAVALDLSQYRMVDLGHSYNDQTLYWPTSPSRFEFREISEGETDGGWYYSAYSVCTPEHGGTHLDAPRHFSTNGRATDAMPLTDLIAPGVVIDVSRQADGNPGYLLTADDVREFEATHGRIAPGTIVLLRTGWSRFWPDARRYLGDDTPGDASRLRFPSYGADAARALVEERQVALLGVDTASIDHGASRDFPVHRIAGDRNVAGLENLTRLEELPATGFTVIALPMKIEGGSGGPARVVALVPK